MIQVVLFESSNGRSPFKDWIESINDIQTVARIRARIDRLYRGTWGDFKALGDEIFEMRFYFGSGYRVYFGKKGKEIVILLTGGDKSSQSKDIAKAKVYWAAYKNNKET